MHKGIILLVKPEDEDNNKFSALNKAREFMDDHEGTVWDWWAVGGRWTQVLCPKTREFSQWANEFLLSKEPKVDGQDAEWISQQNVDDNQHILQKKWEDMGLIGKNSYCNHYKIGQDGGAYDAMPLSECLEVVNAWKQDYIALGKEKLKDAENWLNGETGTNNYEMYGYVITKAGKLFQQDFFDECNVFNVENYNYSVPEDVTGWWAVMVDIHN